MRQRGRKTPLKTLTNPLSVVGSSRSVPAPPPPDYLSAAMQAWWKQVMANYELEPHHIHLLQAACEAWDRMQQARKVLAENGLSYEDSRGRHHPLPEVAIERDSRIGFARLVRELGLDDATPPAEAGARPPLLRARLSGS
jgi:P27 family predicted phage terminase small subunit